MVASEFFRSCAAAVNNASCVRTVSPRLALSETMFVDFPFGLKSVTRGLLVYSYARGHPLQTVGARGQDQYRGEKETDQEQREQDHSAASQELGGFHQSQRLQRKNTSMAQAMIPIPT